MSSDTTALSSMTRSKLQLSVSGRDPCSLHRWVLLKNSVLNVQPPTPLPPTPLSSLSTQPVAFDDTDDSEEEEMYSFMFPNIEKLTVDRSNPPSEIEWLNSLLETLGDDDDFGVEADIHTPVGDDDDDPSPIPSPMSSQDDLTTSFYPPMPYPALYSVFQPPTQTQFESALPYYDSDDLENLSVPDAIEDLSDDESETLTTPSLGRSSQSLYLDPASIPLPADHSRLRYSHHPYIVDTKDFNPFELDPLPFPFDHSNLYNNAYSPQC